MCEWHPGVRLCSILTPQSQEDKISQKLRSENDIALSDSQVSFLLWSLTLWCHSHRRVWFFKLAKNLHAAWHCNQNYQNVQNNSACNSSAESDSLVWMTPWSHTLPREWHRGVKKTILPRKFGGGKDTAEAYSLESESNVFRPPMALRGKIR